jgi:dTDP-4-dehydrorhamnose 3,5-epimerase
VEFRETTVEGVWLVSSDWHKDDRGGFARLFCPEDFARGGIKGFTPVQINLSTNPAALTLRGMHYQPRPMAEDKFVFAARGRVFDVALDLRPESASYLKWFGQELVAGSGQGLFIPQGCAHGFLTLEEHSDVCYLMGRMFAPGYGACVRWDDPAFGIQWPDAPAIISLRDSECPEYAGQPG